MEIVWLFAIYCLINEIIGGSILKIQDIHKYLLGIYMFKNNIKNNLPYPAYDHNNRRSNNVLVAFQRLSLTQHSIDYETPLFWNSLSLDSYQKFIIFVHFQKGTQAIFNT